MYLVGEKVVVLKAAGGRVGIMQRPREANGEAVEVKPK